MTYEFCFRKWFSYLNHPNSVCDTFSFKFHLEILLSVSKVRRLRYKNLNWICHPTSICQFEGKWSFLSSRFRKWKYRVNLLLQKNIWLVTLFNAAAKKYQIHSKYPKAGCWLWPYLSVNQRIFWVDGWNIWPQLYEGFAPPSSDTSRGSVIGGVSYFIDTFRSRNKQQDW